MSSTPSPSLTHLAVTRAIGMLKGLGADYAIRLPDGSTFGDLEIAPPRDKSKRVVVNHWAKDLGYADTMRAMGPGSHHSWSVGAGAPSLRGSISGMAHRMWGKDNYICTISGDDRGTVELLRVA
jgi:hypothetical protein